MEYNKIQIPVAISIYLPNKSSKIFLLYSIINIELSMDNYGKMSLII